LGDEHEKVNVSEYRHLPDQSRSGKISFSDQVAEHETVQKAVTKHLSTSTESDKGFSPAQRRNLSEDDIAAQPIVIMHHYVGLVVNPSVKPAKRG
jgi:hypothetical protein